MISKQVSVSLPAFFVKYSDGSHVYKFSECSKLRFIRFRYMSSKPNIPAKLLWEFDYENFNFDKSYKVVIERILQRGNMSHWREMVRYYSREQILETIEWSAQLEERDKRFSRFFLNSDFLHVP